MKKIKLALAIIVIIAALGTIINRSFFGGLLMLILGVALLPIVSSELTSRIGFWNKKSFRYAFYIFLLLLSTGIINKNGLPKNKKEDSVVTETNITKRDVEKTESKKQPIELDHSEFWDEFDPIVKQRVYKMIQEKDCTGLQKEFNITADNMDRLQASGKSGSRNLKLMEFLEDKMKELDCN